MAFFIRHVSFLDPFPLKFSKKLARTKIYVYSVRAGCESFSALNHYAEQSGPRKVKENRSESKLEAASFAGCVKATALNSLC
ncbi:hypothetical protein Leryth_020872 [Lithospermum erythrorhizon]|nr:hypothetical protein Leryth_020872 [Lithospermum erythrorhizon]